MGSLIYLGLTKLIKHLIDKFGGYFEVSCLKQPNNLVRLCRRQPELISIINEAIKFSDEEWSQDLIKRVIKYILEGGTSEISVYKVDTLDPLDRGHSFAVVAEGISQKEFRKTAKKRKFGCTRGCLIIPRDCLPKSSNCKFTPENNLDFYPANDYHFDLEIGNSAELAIAILDGIRQREIAWTFLGNNDGTYHLQCAITYSHCLPIFGKLDPSNPSLEWTDGRNLTASEQIEILIHLAQTKALDSPSN